MREELIDGKYTLVLEFMTRKEMTRDMWDSRLDKIQTFFGPGITAEVGDPWDRRVCIHESLGTWPFDKCSFWMLTEFK